ncbi:MAG: family 10 glycosylhydrolase [Planctomycetota bacterium]
MQGISSGLGRVVGIVVMGLGLFGCSTAPRDARSDIPEVPREFRAAWVATVANIDWPSTKTLSTQEQKDELIAIFDRAVELKLNAIVLQVRPAGDALYQPGLEPWSEWLTGEIGKAPDPYYDPLAFAIEEAHRRGLELHAWFNPYRVLHPTNKSEPSPDHIAVTHPHLVKEYGKFLWLDPGAPEVQAHSLAVMLDVVKRYDLDGVHMDDYFYPYPIKDDDGNEIEFPDGDSYAAYRKAWGFKSRDDWRRWSVDTFVRDLYREVKRIKPHVKVGISPFGIYRPGNPRTIQGFDQYDKLYADALKWYRKGWVDYFTPQLYWAIAPPPQSFSTLLNWWDQQNPKGRHLWPGLYTSRMLAENPRGFTPDEIGYQIAWTRLIESSPPGHVHFSMKALMPKHHEEIGGPIAAKAYAEPALVPATPWLKGKRPAAPRGTLSRVDDKTLRVTPAPPSLENAAGWVTQVKRGEDWEWAYYPSTTPEVVVDPSGLEALVVFTVDRRGVRSPKAEFVGPTEAALQ